MRAILAAAIITALSVSRAAAQVPADVLHTFTPGEPASPISLVTAADGSIYGASERGGYFDGGSSFHAGTIFRVAPDGGVTVVRSFDESLSRPSSLVFAAGTLYGLAFGPSALRGAVFAMNPDGSNFRVVHLFSDATGGGRAHTLILGADGLLYGSSPNLDDGRVFQLDPATDTFTVLHAFTGVPVTQVIAGSDGNLYGIASPDVVFRVTAAGAFAELKRFVWGVDCLCAPVALPGISNGTLFVELDNASIARLPIGGGSPVYSSLNAGARWLGWILAGDGNFYSAKGLQILRLTPQGQSAIVHQLGEGTFGDLWPVPMTLAPDGGIVGATRQGGPHDRGRIFRFATDGTFTWLHSMLASPEGEGPGHLVRGAGGMMYGTARLGGTFNLGTAFSVAPDGTFTVLHSFSGGADGAYPIGLTAGSDGNLYGTTYRGGANNAGMLFRMSPAGSVVPVHVFSDDGTVRRPTNVPMQASDGAFYGTTDTGVYRCAPDGTFALVHVFDEFSIFPGDPSPVTPVPLVEMDGVLYGAISSFNAIGDGLPPSNPFIFALGLDGGYGIVSTFDAASFVLTGALVSGRDGRLYGTSLDTFFAITPGGVRTDYAVLPHSGSFYGRTFTRVLMQAADSGDFYCSVRPSGDSLAPSAGGVCRVSIGGGFSLLNDRVADALVQRFDGTIEGINYLSGLRAEGPEQIFRFAPPQQMALDSPLAGSTMAQPFVLAGWAIDRTATGNAGIDAVHVWAYPSAGGPPVFVGTAQCCGNRPDVMAVFGAQFASAGFSLAVDGLAAGSYTFVAYAHSSETGTFNQWRLATITVTVRPPGLPVMSLDTPQDATTATQPLQFAGWAADLDSTSGPGVDVLHVWAIPAGGGGATFAGVASTGGVRNDVGAAFGPQFATAGFNFTIGGLAQGTYHLVVYAHSTVTDTFSQWRVVTVTIQ